jgi:acyl-CoA thioesterase
VTVGGGASTTAAFAAATAVTADGDGRYAAVCDTAWSAPRGPNGGYLAAIVLRAMEAEVGDPARHARSVTCHFLRPPADGPVEVLLAVERSGRSVTALTARLEQAGRLCVVAVAAFGTDFGGAADWATPAPAAPPPQDVPPWSPGDHGPPIARRIETRPVFGAAPFGGGPEALTGGWLRLAEPAPCDAAALAFYADAWLPAPFARMTAPVAAPTIDLTVHFRAPGAVAAVGPEDHLLVRFRSTTSAGGFFEEDGELWRPDGTLLAQSRQLALLLPLGGPR